MCLAARIAARFTAAGHSVAVAETSAGGLIASELLAQSGASKFFRGGVVAYSKHAKQMLIGLDPAASQPTSTEPHAVELARAMREKLGTDWAIAETGTAGPKPRSAQSTYRLSNCQPSGATSSSSGAAETT